MNMKRYDYLLVGAGLFNAILAYELSRIGKKCLVIDKRSHLGGNMYCDHIAGIDIHSYGPHIFHTNNKYIWDYVNNLCEFKPFVYSPLACYKGNLYNLPFNMHTFYELWGVKTSVEAQKRIKEQLIPLKNDNLEEYALSTFGSEIYETLIKGYTEKQWGQEATMLPAFILKRLPLRFTFNNNYFEDFYQGIPIGGYNSLFVNAFRTCELMLDTDFIQNRDLSKLAETVIFTGMIDEYYDYCCGVLEYRSLCFETETIYMEDFQSSVVVNYTEREVPYTRIIEHKHFEGKCTPNTIITKEYPQEWHKGREPYYPVNTKRNESIYKEYKMRSILDQNVFFAGRLGTYRYMNMDQIIKEALELFKQLKK